MFSKADWQKLQVDGIALALNGIYVSPDFTRYECFRSLEIIIGTKLFFLNHDHSKMSVLCLLNSGISLILYMPL